MTDPLPRSAAVIGGGIVGLSTGLALQKRGLAVTLLDAPGERPPASWGNAGHIAVEQHEPLASYATVRSLPRNLMSFGGPASFPSGSMAQWLPFGLRLLRAAQPATLERGRRALASLMGQALPAWQRLIGDVDAPALLRDGGTIIAWESLGGARRGRAAVSRLGSAVAHGRDLTQAEAAALSGVLRTAPADALCIEGTATVADPGAVLDRLRETFRQRGGTIETRAATLAQTRALGADVTVVAAGVHSGPLMRSLGHGAPIIAERGYHIQSAESRWPSSLPSVVFEERALVATRFLSGLRATSFVEFTRPDAPPDPRKWERLKAHARDLGLPFDAQPATWLGSRPTLPDYLPAIGRSSRDRQVLYAFGHQHLGLTLGPVTGEIVAALACSEPASVDAAPFAIERFG